MFTRTDEDLAMWVDQGNALIIHDQRSYEMLQLTNDTWIVSGRLTSQEHADRKEYLPVCFATPNVPGVLGFELSVVKTGEIIGYCLGIHEFGPIVKRHYQAKGLI